jgi:hypothetical protein
MPWHVPKRQRRLDVLVGDGGPGQVGRAVGGEPIDAAGVYITSVCQNHLMVFIPYQIRPIRLYNHLGDASAVKAGGMADVLPGIALERLEKSPLADEATDLLLPR